MGQMNRLLAPLASFFLTFAAACAGSPRDVIEGTAGTTGSAGDVGSSGTTGSGTGGTGGSAGAAGTTARGGTTGAAGRGGTTGAAGTTGAGGSGPIPPRTACTAPARYRNLFTEILGKTQADVDTKMTTIVQQLFHGTGSTQPIYYELGSSQAYIEDIADNDVRSEGQSYGMFIAVQMNMKTEFDKLWSYAKSCMQQPNGTFAWQMNVGSCTPKSTGQAPDGDEYFAEALRLASKRWGNSTGTDYGSEAKKVLQAMVTAGDFKSSPAIVTFSANANYSDPSYVLPLFYSEWACFDTTNATLWKNATTYARTFFGKATNASTGLAPYQANLDGTPYAAGNTFNADAWRVPMNIMADYALNTADPWQATYAATNAAFWTGQGLTSYGDKYTLDGQKQESGHGAGLTGVNAMLAFGLPVADASQFLLAAWNVAIPTGTYRYYDGCLYMLSMLYMSGKVSLFY
jgi:oligosaccharide reducing-end xylanase